MIAQAFGLLLFGIVMVGGPAVIWHAIAVQRDQRTLRKVRERLTSVGVQPLRLDESALGA